MKIINQLGETVMNGFHDESNRINIKGHSVGVYFLSQPNKISNSTHKLVKQ